MYTQTRNDSFNIFIPSYEYQWMHWDCYRLIKYVREEIDGIILPSIYNDVYRHYPTEENLPKNLIINVVKKYCTQTQELDTGNIVILTINHIDNLGIIVNKNVVFMGNRTATIQPLSRMSEYVDSIWEYQVY